MSAALIAGSARAQVLYDQTSEIGAAGVAPPVEYSFVQAATQALTVTLTDDQAPAPLASLQIAITLGDSLIDTAIVASGTTSASVNIPGTAGTYGLHVIGVPTGSLGLGSFSICVAPQGSPSSCTAAGSQAFSGNIQAPATISTNGISTLDTTFTTSAAGGTYTVRLTDDAFPVALSQIYADITLGSTAVVSGIGPGAPTPVTLAPATTYTLLIPAAADPTVLAGLYGIQITDPNGQVVFGRTLPVGLLGPSSIVSNPAAQALQLTLTDEGYPAPLVSVGAAVTSGAMSYAALTNAGQSPSVTMPAGNLEVWQYAVATTQTPGVYALTLAAGATNLYSATQVVESPNAATATSFAYLATIPAAGTYTVAVNDFQLPPLQSLGTPAVAQNGTPLAVSSGGNFTAAAGPVVVLVNAQAQTGQSGIFSVTVGQAGAPLLLDQTQSLGGIFYNQQINVSTAGTYDVSLTDLGFPASFQSLAAVLSGNGQVLGKKSGGGMFQVTASPGQYLLTFAATPGSQNYGLYSINVAMAAPSVTLNASATSVTAGQSVQLTWTSSGAGSCVAGGAPGWSGNESTSGTLGVTINASVTLTLSCTGPGGSTTQSATITAIAAPPPAGGGSGGGGQVDFATILGLLSLLGIRHFRLSALKPLTGRVYAASHRQLLRARIPRGGPECAGRRRCG